VPVHQQQHMREKASPVMRLALFFAASACLVPLIRSAEDFGDPDDPTTDSFPMDDEQTSPDFDKSDSEDFEESEEEEDQDKNGDQNDKRSQKEHQFEQPKESEQKWRSK